jgi:hypothetical protein
MTHIMSGVQLFPYNHVYNTPIVNLPVHASSASWITSIGPTSVFDAKFSQVSTNNWGIPLNLVTNATTTYMPTISAPFAPPRSYAGPYPIPASPLIENGVDLHLLCLNTDNGLYYELINAVFAAGAWSADSGGMWDLSKTDFPLASNNPVWGDSAVLPMIAGLVFYDEVASGTISHALRITISNGSGTFVWPASHADGSTGGAPPHGSRFRLKASFNISGFSANNQVILKALQRYGGFLSDQCGASFFRINGMPDNRWNDTDIALLNTGLTANNFEVVDESSLLVSSTSMAATQARNYTRFTGNL